ncbi:MAG: zf-HC2 domain-containing protein [Candidatus Aminicenantes bacterium]
MRCDKARKWISDDLDGALPGSRKARLEDHLAGCPACRAYLGDLELIAGEARGRPADDPPPGYWPDFGRRLERRLASPAPPARTAPRLGYRRWAWAGAASLVVVAVAVYIAFLRPGVEQDAAWFPNGSSLASILLEAEGDPDLTSRLDGLVSASIEELTVGPDEDIPVPFADDPLFWEGLSEEELRFIVSELEAETDRGVRP